MKSFVNSEIQIINKLTPHFKFRDSKNIGKYILSNMFLLQVLEECYQNIGNYFPNDELALEVIQDPMDNNEKLAIYNH